MLKRFLQTAFLSLLTSIAFAATDVNSATQAELEAVKGVGPAISAKIMGERQKAPFKSWADLIERVSGVGDANAVKFSAAGLTVGGAAFKGAAPAPAAAVKPAPAVAVKPAPAVAVKPAPAVAVTPAPAAAVTPAPAAATTPAPAASKAAAVVAKPVPMAAAASAAK